MASVLGAFFLIMITGGCIAYFGDRLGYVMGKRRVTIFGLRPRHTAQVLTVISGVIIGGLALTLLLVVNYTFRIALLNGRDLLITNHRLKHNNNLLSKQASANRAAAQAAELEADGARAQAADATRVLHVSEQNLAMEQAKTAGIRLQLSLKQQELVALSSQLSGERQQLTQVQANVDRAGLQLKFAVEKAKQELQSRRNGTLIYRNDQELGRDVISASASQADIRLELTRFLDRLSRGAGTMGATTGANHRSVVLATIQFYDQKEGASDSQNQAFVDENDSLNALAYSISSYGHGSVVVIARAFGNSYDGQQVIIVLRPYANLLVIPSGTELGETLINDSSATADQIVDQLQRFLVTKVRPKAIAFGVIPVTDAQTGTVQLGDVTLDQIYDVVQQVRNIGGPAIITATASQDTFSADELKLNFSVKPVASNVQ